MYRNWPNRLPLRIIKCKYFNLFSITIGSISVIKEFVKNINCTTINELKRDGKLVKVINVFIHIVPSMLALWPLLHGIRRTRGKETSPWALSSPEPVVSSGHVVLKAFVRYK